MRELWRRHVARLYDPVYFITSGIVAAAVMNLLGWIIFAVAVVWTR